MAQTFERLVVEDFEVIDDTDKKEVKHIAFKKGDKVLTSGQLEDGRVLVLAKYWFRMPLKYFSGAVQMTS